MLGGVAAIIAIVFFVTAHEAGHFLAAKAVGLGQCALKPHRRRINPSTVTNATNTQALEPSRSATWNPVGGIIRER